MTRRLGVRAKRRLASGIDERLQEIESTEAENYLANVDEHHEDLQEDLYHLLSAWQDLHHAERFDLRDEVDDEIDDVLDEAFSRSIEILRRVGSGLAYT